MKMNVDIYMELNQLFKRLNCMHRWTSIVTENKYNELNKQSLNSLCTYVLASMVEESGVPIKWENFPKIAIYRAFNKAYVSYDTPEHIIKRICEIGGIPNSAFTGATKDIISTRTNHEFMSFISSALDTNEYQIFRAGTKIATYMELKEQANWADAQELKERMEEVRESLKEFETIPAVSELLKDCNPVFKVIQRITKLRNSNRWAVHSYLTDCSVLGHLFDTAVLAYFIAYEEFNGYEALATKFFFMGIFHDIAEAWTTDIPSDIKDHIAGFRDASELFEKEMLDKYLYSQLPEYLQKKVKEVMFEEDDNLAYKRLMKGADYLSADCECWRQYIAGSRETYYYTSAIKGFDNSLIAGFKAKLPREARKLHEEIKHYVEKVIKGLMDI